MGRDFAVFVFHSSFCRVLISFVLGCVGFPSGSSLGILPWEKKEQKLPFSPVTNLPSENRDTGIVPWASARLKTALPGAGNYIPLPQRLFFSALLPEDSSPWILALRIHQAWCQMNFFFFLPVGLWNKDKPRARNTG